MMTEQLGPPGAVLFVLLVVFVLVVVVVFWLVRFVLVFVGF